ncbi:hypothetical protein PQU92_07130 [Asticcacaulis sp. BYS171W]|uniref:Uncharacterized protein n=1 Tax=Asticcacaulis aquaticus TaxID=2984212 RepID=A0ABT5HSJ9_9CAUL|nr:hypothetical protein [Asticcacaulis aquaticus]MDC7683043.1 hypothetical protein [Asticcacaulis aquaticus]
MSDAPIESRLPAEILAKANFQHGEYAWKVRDIPAVIKAAVDTNLMNLGGQLQIRIPGCIGECDWVETDPAAMVPDDLPWDVRIRMVAEMALTDWEDLKNHFNFEEQIRLAFPDPIKDFLSKGGKIEDAIWFCWYVIDEDGDREHRESLPPMEDQV